MLYASLIELRLYPAAALLALPISKSWETTDVRTTNYLSVLFSESTHWTICCVTFFTGTRSHSRHSDAIRCDFSRQTRGAIDVVGRLSRTALLFCTENSRATCPPFPYSARLGGLFCLSSQPTFVTESVQRQAADAFFFFALLFVVGGGKTRDRGYQTFLIFTIRDCEGMG